MRYVKKDLKDIPPSLISEEALVSIELIATRAVNIIPDNIYKGTYYDNEGRTQSRVRDYLNKYYKYKCAYCESYCKAEIEHYRPKKGVTGEPSHNGYFWLCYTWSNLVPSCRYCNTEGGKGNQFPIIKVSNRVLSPEFNKEGKLDISKCSANLNPLINERPYLLHPEIDKKPEKFLCFRISVVKEGIEIIGFDTPGRGQSTINICNLNRQYLKLNRLEAVYYNVKQKINLIFDLNSQGLLMNENVGDALNLVFKEIENESKDESLSHTLLRKFIVKDVSNFTNHFIPYLDDEEQRAISIAAFTNYKSST